MSVKLPSLQESQAVAASWLEQFCEAMQPGADASLGGLFTPDAYWRDILAFTWDLKTTSGAESVVAALGEACGKHRPSKFLIDRGTLKVFTRKMIGPTIEVFFDFETDIAQCRGHVRLRPVIDQGGRWLAWTVFTAMEGLKGFEEKAGQNRRGSSSGTSGHGALSGWKTSDEHAATYESESPEVLVIGGAQTGLAVAARLGSLDVPTLVVERQPRVGDVWRNRYQSLVLHNQIWANHLPYMEFPANWPVYVSKDQLAEWLEIYAQAMSIATWTSSTIERSEYDSTTGRWNIAVRRADGATRTLHPSHVIMATGVFGKPRRLDLPGAEGFSGTIVNAADYSGSHDVRGKRVLVIGSGSSAHDVAKQIHDDGALVTLLQRGSTCVVSLDPGATIPYSIYKEAGIPTDQADMLSNSIPFALLGELHKEMTRQIAELDADMLGKLNDAGFATNFGDDGSGFLMQFFRRGGGYYINVGASDLIIDGKIRIKGNAEITGLTGQTVHFSDGSHDDFDTIVVAIGYENMQETIRDVLGSAVAERVGPVWGLGDDGELRNMWRPTGQPGLWIAGGSLQQNRSFSKYLALQIKGKLVSLN